MIPNNVDLGGVSKVDSSSIPGSRKTNIETPLNPKGNQSKILVGKQGVIVEPK